MDSVSSSLIAADGPTIRLQKGTIRILSNRSPYTSIGRLDYGEPGNLRIEVLDQTREAGGLVVVAGIPLERAAQSGQRVVWYAAAQDPSQAAVRRVLGLPEDGDLSREDAARVEEMQRFEREVARLPSNIGWIPAKSASGDPAQSIHIRPVDIPSHIYQPYYADHANQFLWLLHHGFPTGLSHDAIRESFGAYKQANRLFVEELAQDAEDGDTIWINDYHNIFAGQYLIERLGQIAADRKTHGLGDGDIPSVNVVGFWHIAHATADEFMLNCPRDVATEYFNAMTYIRWGFHSPRWADNYAECVIEFGDADSVNRLAGGLDSSARERLIERLASHRLSRMFRDLDAQTLQRWLADVTGDSAKRLLEKVDDTAAARILVAIPDRIRNGVERYYNETLDRRVLTVPEPELGPPTALSHGLFIAPATINPNADRAFAQTFAVEEAMGELEAQLTELNGGVPFNEGPRFNIIARRGDPKNGVDVELLAFEKMLDEGPAALFITGDASRQTVAAFREQYQLEESILERIMAHPNARVIHIAGTDQAKKVASMRISDIPLIGARRGGRDIVGAEFGLAHVPGDRPMVPIVGAEIPISETIEGVYGGEVRHLTGSRHHHGDHRLRGAVVVEGIGPEVPREVAAERLYRQMSELNRLRVTNPKEFERRCHNYILAVEQENGEAWFVRVLAEAHPTRMIQEGVLRNATSEHFVHQLAHRVDDTLRHKGTPSPTAVEALQQAGYEVSNRRVVPVSASL